MKIELTMEELDTIISWGGFTQAEWIGAGWGGSDEALLLKLCEIPEVNE